MNEIEVQKPSLYSIQNSQGSFATSSTTYNQAGLTYNQAGQIYGGFYGNADPGPNNIEVETI